MQTGSTLEVSHQPLHHLLLKPRIFKFKPFYLLLSLLKGFSGGLALKVCLPMQETWVKSLGWKDPLDLAWQPTPVFLFSSVVVTEAAKNIPFWN